MASITKYLFIDDDNQEPLIKKIMRHNKHIEIISIPPKKFDDTLEIFSPSKFKYDGLILDLRLNEKRFKGQDYPINYRASTVVQELRSRSSDASNPLGEFPIILLSDESNIKDHYERDESSHDLFDEVYGKDDVSNNPEVFAAQAISLANGYDQIAKLRAKSKPSSPWVFLGRDISNGVPDIRIDHNFDSKSWRIPIHEYANFILNEIIKHPGILIDEQLLASRLGIDIEASGPTWSKLLSKIPKSAKYMGVFSNGWERWWGKDIEIWWEKTIAPKKSLHDTPASERVKILKTKFTLSGLHAARPIEKNYSEYFWVVCKARNCPLDPVNGFMINEEEPKPWQERQYISLIAAKKKEKYYEGIKVHPLELPRLKALK